MSSGLAFLQTLFADSELVHNLGSTTEMLIRVMAGGGLSPESSDKVTPAKSAKPADHPDPPCRMPIVTRRAEHDVLPQVVRLTVTGEAVVQTLTACLDNAPCRESTRRIFRALFQVALEVARHQGHAASVTRAVYYLPAELLMAYLNLKKSSFYDNLLYLRKTGLVACEAHMGDLRGKKVATGTLWAISLQPGRVLHGQAAPVRLLHDDWNREWRNLNRDVKEGRTVYNLLHPRVEAEPDSQEIPKRGIDLETLQLWALQPFFQKECDTLTLRQPRTSVMEVVWTLGDAANTQKHQRAAIIDRQARTLAAAFGDDAHSLGFWRKLLWNITRGIDAGKSIANDVATVLVRVLGDIAHGCDTGGPPPRRPGAVVNAALTEAGLLEQLRTWDGLKVGSRPII